MTGGADYEALFDERMRAAHLATLLYARATVPNRWPTIPMVREIARVFGVPSAELGAFFGLIVRREGNREIWWNALRDGPGRHVAMELMSDKQRFAYRYMCAAVGA